MLSSQSGSPSLASCLPAARPKAYGLPARTDLLRVPQRTSSSGRNSFSLWGVVKMCFVHAPFCPRIDTGIRQIETGQLCEPRAVEKPSQFLMRDVTMANTSKTNRNCQHRGEGALRSGSRYEGQEEGEEGGRQAGRGRSAQGNTRHTTTLSSRVVRGTKPTRTHSNGRDSGLTDCPSAGAGVHLTLPSLSPLRNTHTQNATNSAQVRGLQEERRPRG